jgi:probable phosphoglycerate mutase
METRKVFLIRHGRIKTQDTDKRYIGQIDLPLDEEGIRQAVCLQKKLAGEDISTIYCSDLSRTLKTAEIIAADMDIRIITRKDLREISLGEWEGCAFTDIERRFPSEFKARGEDIAYYRVAGGESFAECGQRVTAAFDDIMRCSTGNIVIVGHAGGNRLILCHLLGIPLANLFRIRQDFGCLNIIRCSISGCQVDLPKDVISE